MSRRTRLKFRGARGLLIGCLLLFCVGALSCDETQFGEQERRDVNTVLSTGIGLSSDPYVQAETLRVLESIGNPTLNHYAEHQEASSGAPLWCVAAPWVLLANDSEAHMRTRVLRVSGCERISR